MVHSSSRNVPGVAWRLMGCWRHRGVVFWSPPCRNARRKCAAFVEVVVARGGLVQTALRRD